MQPTPLKNKSLMHQTGHRPKEQSCYTASLKNTWPCPTVAIRILSDVSSMEEFSNISNPPPLLTLHAIRKISDERCLEQSMRIPPPVNNLQRLLQRHVPTGYRDWKPFPRPQWP